MKTKRQREKANKTVYASSKKRTEDHNSGFAPTAFKVPEGCRAFKFKKAGKYRIDVMPFIVGKGNPFADPGVAHYERTFWVHKSVGPEQNSYCCLRKCFNKPCPICEHTAKLRRNPSVDIKAVKEMEPKERQLFVFKDLTDTEYDGYYVYEGSHFKGFGEILDAKVKASEDDDNFENFFHLEDGMTLRVLTEEDRFNGRTFYKPTNLDMLPRKEQYDESILAEIPCLDECLIEKSYKELKKLFDQGGADEGDDDSDDEEEVPAKKAKKGKPVDDDEDEEVAEVEEDEDSDDEEEEDETDVFNKGDEVTFVTSKGKIRKGTITKINDKKKLAFVKVAGQETDSVVDLADLKLVEDEEDTDEEEDLPVKKVKKDKPKKKAEDEDDDDQEEVSEEDSEDASDDDDESDSDAEDDDEPDEEEDAEEEEPVKPAKKKKKAPEPEEDEDADVDWDADDEPEEEDEEEEEPAPKKKKKK